MLQVQTLETDVLVIGGGAAGCYAALTIAEETQAGQVRVLIAEKAHIKRSGCLAAGVNALNAYINPGETPESYVNYVKRDSAGVIREDLVYTMAQRLNRVTAKVEEMGLPMLKDVNGNYVARGKRSIKINGENIKPLLAKAVQGYPQIQVLNRVNVTDYIVQDGRVIGAYAFSLEEPIFYVISAKAVICTTGGASGLYKPNNPGYSRHKMWYSPFNTGAGYAMGIRAGAEMTTFEMRFIALRCKDTIAPTGTIAQGVGAEQVNGQGAEYVTKYGKPTTPMRLAATVAENQGGRGPCYLNTVGITAEQEEELYKAYLNMAPAQTLHWVERGRGPRVENVEIEGTEPYIVGGHTASGYWVDTHRATTLPGLYAAGDVAGGSPKKYVTGCFAEGEIAAIEALKYIGELDSDTTSSLVGNSVADPTELEKQTGNSEQKELDQLEHLEEVEMHLAEINCHFHVQGSTYSVGELEEAMQKVMDEYAGGISAGYAYNSAKLEVARQRIAELRELVPNLQATDLFELLQIYELRDRLEVCRVLLEHLAARQETRWASYQENRDYPQRDDANWLKYVNSRMVAGQIEILYRDLVERDEHYEH